MLNIFISFSQYDGKVIDEILQLIQFSGNKLWYYKRTYSNKTMDEVLKLIESMDIFILFLSKNSEGNEYVRQEILAAKKCMRIKDYLTVILDLQVDQSSIPQFTFNHIIYNNSSKEIADDISKIIF